MIDKIETENLLLGKAEYHHQEHTKCQLIKIGHQCGLLQGLSIQPVFHCHFIKAGLSQERLHQGNLQMQSS
jgi:hypothetical protein